MSSSIPDRALVERGLPIEDIFELAIREGSSKKPIYQIHKWWARRLGVFSGRSFSPQHSQVQLDIQLY